MNLICKLQYHLTCQSDVHADIRTYLWFWSPSRNTNIILVIPSQITIIDSLIGKKQQFFDSFHILLNVCVHQGDHPFFSPLNWHLNQTLKCYLYNNIYIKTSSFKILHIYIIVVYVKQKANKHKNNICIQKFWCCWNCVHHKRQTCCCSCSSIWRTSVSIDDRYSNEYQLCSTICWFVLRADVVDLLRELF